jgi:two-component system chemotaxis family response regulator WspR
MVDVDHFKIYNDTYGHQGGDEILRVIADCLGNTLRRHGDLAARFGGEEFAVVLPVCTPSGAKIVADRIRATVAARNIPHKGSARGTLTVSIGVATLHPSQISSGFRAMHLVAAADRGLYLAKENGRNRSEASEVADDVAIPKKPDRRAVPCTADIVTMNPAIAPEKLLPRLPHG